MPTSLTTESQVFDCHVDNTRNEAKALYRSSKLGTLIQPHRSAELQKAVPLWGYPTRDQAYVVSTPLLFATADISHQMLKIDLESLTDGRESCSANA